MRIKLLVGCLVATAVVGGGFAFAVNNTNVAGTKTVKEVMKIAHAKEGLHSKILAGTGTDEDKKQLLDLYLDMAEGEPKKGDKAEFKVVASAAMASAAKVMLGREGAIEELKKTSDCKACHSKFK